MRIQTAEQDVARAIIDKLINPNKELSGAAQAFLADLRDGKIRIVRDESTPTLFKRFTSE